MMYTRLPFLPSPLKKKKKFNHDGHATGRSSLHEKIVGLDVTMNEVFAVDELNAGDELIRKKENCLKAESARAKVEQVFERRAQQLHDHHVEVAFGAAPLDCRYADSALHDSVEL